MPFSNVAHLARAVGRRDDTQTVSTVSSDRSSLSSLSSTSAAATKNSSQDSTSGNRRKEVLRCLKDAFVRRSSARSPLDITHRPKIDPIIGMKVAVQR